MPRDRKNGTWTKATSFGPALAALMLLSACMGSGDTASQPKVNDVDLAGTMASKSPSPQAGGSKIIGDLRSRKSVLPAGGSYAKSADAVLAADSGAAAAELRVAQLKSDARSKNWLPSVGPSVTLSSLDGLVAGLLLQQPMFDNGGRKAQRAFASADVEVAAVSLSTAQNQRIFLGLSYYVNAERAREQAAVSLQAAGKLDEFGEIMRKRVAGGISDMSEQRVIDQALAEMRATLAGDQQAEASAMAELAALTAQPMAGVRGLDTLAPTSAEPLAVAKARGEGARAIAQSDLQLSEMKLGIGTVAELGEDGINPGVRLTGMGALNPGAKSDIAALKQTADVVDRQTADAADVANRRIVSFEQQRATLAARQAQGAEVLRQTAGNLELFTTQYKVGRRTLLELVSQYGAYARLQRDQASLRFDMALMDLEIARDRGVLVDGARL